MAGKADVLHVAARVKTGPPYCRVGHSHSRVLFWMQEIHSKRDPEAELKYVTKQRSRTPEGTGNLNYLAAQACRLRQLASWI